MKPRVFTHYTHFDWPSQARAWVREDLKGRHREHCLCYTPCAKFKPGQPDNCPIAQATYEHCVQFNTITPVWECPAFEFTVEPPPREHKERPMIYVAGPISKGPLGHNVRQALFAARELWRKGWLPFVPHLSVFWNLIDPPEDVRAEFQHVKPDGQLHFWMDYDFQMLGRCDAMVRLPGASVGADMEIEFCVARDIPVFFAVEVVPRVGEFSLLMGWK